jgi:hypothetical protein
MLGWREPNPGQCENLTAVHVGGVYQRVLIEPVEVTLGGDHGIGAVHVRATCR